jgi:hypothetical protein
MGSKMISTTSELNFEAMSSARACEDSAQARS